MSTQKQINADAPVMKAWENYKASDEFSNTRKWAMHSEHVEGSLWAAFYAGFFACAVDSVNAEAAPETERTVHLDCLGGCLRLKESDRQVSLGASEGTSNVAANTPSSKATRETSNPAVSDTPLTDKIEDTPEDWPITSLVVDADFARGIKRKLRAAEAERDRLQGITDDLFITCKLWQTRAEKAEVALAYARLEAVPLIHLREILVLCDEPEAAGIDSYQDKLRAIIGGLKDQRKAREKAEAALAELRGHIQAIADVLCDSDGRVIVRGSPKNRAILQDSIDALHRMGVIAKEPAAPLASTATFSTAPSQEGVGRGGKADAAATTCGYCTYEEADGSLIEQCAKCKAADAAATSTPETDAPDATPRNDDFERRYTALPSEEIHLCSEIDNLLSDLLADHKELERERNADLQRIAELEAEKDSLIDEMLGMRKQLEQHWRKVVDAERRANRLQAIIDKAAGELPPLPVVEYALGADHIDETPIFKLYSEKLREAAVALAAQNKALLKECRNELMSHGCYTETDIIVAIDAAIGAGKIAKP